MPGRMTSRHHCQPLDSERQCSLLEIIWKGGGTGDHIEDDVPLRAEDDERAQPDIGIELEAHDAHHGEGKEDVGGKGSEELGQGLNTLGDAWAQADPDADGNPEQPSQAQAASTTRSRVSEVEPIVSSRSAQDSSVLTNAAIFHADHAVASPIAANQTTSMMRDAREPPASRR